VKYLRDGGSFNASESAVNSGDRDRGRHCRQQEQGVTGTSAVLTWGAAGVYQYSLYKGGAYLASVPAGTLTYTYTGSDEHRLHLQC
jgi:hypothetical protein